MPTIGLGHIALDAGVNEDGAPVCRVSATCAERVVDAIVLAGELTTGEARALALELLEVAEAADQSAALLRVIKNLGHHTALADAIFADLAANRITLPLTEGREPLSLIHI